MVELNMRRKGKMRQVVEIRRMLRFCPGDDRNRFQVAEKTPKFPQRV